MLLFENMKALTLIFVILIALLQYPLWLGKGSWLRVWNVNQQISSQKEKNKAFKQRNDTLGAEVRDLKQGNAAIEERARSELGMIKQDEVFYQVIDQPLPTKPLNQLPVAAEEKPPTSEANVEDDTKLDLTVGPTKTLDRKVPIEKTLSQKMPSNKPANKAAE